MTADQNCADKRRKLHPPFASVKSFLVANVSIMIGARRCCRDIDRVVT